MLYSKTTIDELHDKIKFRHAINMDESQWNIWSWNNEAVISYIPCCFCKGFIFCFPVEKKLYCPNCDFKGDIISLMMARDMCTFSDAIEFLAKKADIKLEKVEPHKIRPDWQTSFERALEEIKKLDHPLIVHFLMEMLYTCKEDPSRVEELLGEFIKEGNASPEPAPQFYSEVLVAVRIIDLAKRKLKEAN